MPQTTIQTFWSNFKTHVYLFNYFYIRRVHNYPRLPHDATDFYWRENWSVCLLPISLPVNTAGPGYLWAPHLLLYQFKKDCWLKKRDSCFQSKDSMVGDITTVPTPRAMMTIAKLFMHPCPRDIFPISHLQYLSASLKREWRSTWAPSAKAFSFF